MSIIGRKISKFLPESCNVFLPTHKPLISKIRNSGQFESHELDKIMVEMKNNIWHVVGISKTRRKRENRFKLNVSNQLDKEKGESHV